MFERFQNLWSRDKRLGSGFKWMQFLASTHSHLVIAVLVLSDLESCDECLGLVVVLHLELVPAGQPAHHHQLLHRQLSRLRGGALLIACGPSIREIVQCTPVPALCTYTDTDPVGSGAFSWKGFRNYVLAKDPNPGKKIKTKSKFSFKTLIAVG